MLMRFLCVVRHMLCSIVSQAARCCAKCLALHPACLPQDFCFRSDRRTEFLAILQQVRSLPPFPPPPPPPTTSPYPTLSDPFLSLRTLPPKRSGCPNLRLVPVAASRSSPPLAPTTCQRALFHSKLRSESRPSPRPRRRSASATPKDSRMSRYALRPTTETKQNHNIRPLCFVHAASRRLQVSLIRKSEAKRRKAAAARREEERVLRAEQALRRSAEREAERKERIAGAERCCVAVDACTREAVQRCSDDAPCFLHSTAVCCSLLPRSQQSPQSAREGCAG